MTKMIPWLIAGGVFAVVLVLWLFLGERGIERIEGMWERRGDANPAPVTSQGQIVAQQFFFNDAANAVKPAVVSIHSYQGAYQRGGPAGAGQSFAGGGGHSWQSIGAGVIISPQGYIVTAGQVVAEATHIKITRFDLGHTHIYDGEVVSRFPSIDLAVVKIAVNNPLPSSMLGDSSNMGMGDWVLAIGSPLGMKPMAVSGIISSVDASGALRTSMPAGNGFLGGPLVNSAGEVIGIISGNGYAIASNKARESLNAMQVPYLPNLSLTGGGLR